MPKILPGLKENLLAAAREQLLNGGYAALSLRGIARQCGIAVGTIYNYFDSKDTLVASVMLADWLQTLQQMDADCAAVQNMPQGVLAMHGEIAAFAGVYRPVWNQFSAVGGSSDALNSRHRQLRGQLEQRLLALLARFDRQQDADLVPLLAESILAAAVQTDITPHSMERLACRLFAENHPNKKGETHEQFQRPAYRR